MRLKLAIAFILLNILDICLTLYFVGHGISTELNPVMARVLTYPIIVILAYKILLPTLFMVAILWLSSQPIAQRVNWNLILVLLVVAESGICLFNLTGLLA